MEKRGVTVGLTVTLSPVAMSRVGPATFSEPRLCRLQKPSVDGPFCPCHPGRADMCRPRWHPPSRGTRGGPPPPPPLMPLLSTTQKYLIKQVHSEATSSRERSERELY
ncbi:hypothetical protein B5X24_HaOG209872 [Helicoverpa armigera]|nr:hypothetical protein B5X24_HaOG209872 [Helicoverpa armigera]